MTCSVFGTGLLPINGKNVWVEPCVLCSSLVCSTGNPKRYGAHQENIIPMEKSALQSIK